MKHRRLDTKLARIRNGEYTPADFILADAKDGEMGGGLQVAGWTYDPVSGEQTGFKPYPAYRQAICEMVELAAYDPQRIIVGILGGSAGTNRDTFELLSQGERFGARAALFGRKINFAESPITLVAMMRRVVERDIGPREAVKAYHDALEKEGLRALRPLDQDLAITEPVLKAEADG